MTERTGKTEKYVAAIDQGTTSSRCIIFDQDGAIVAVDQREHRQIFPKPGWVEHDATEIWSKVQAVVAGALAKAGLRADQLSALGITNQRETTVLWDRATGKPVHNAIVWQDTRTSALCAELGGADGQDRFRERHRTAAGQLLLRAQGGLAAGQVPGLRARAERGEIAFGTIDSWLIWNLTGGTDGGVHVTDVTNAGRTMLMNLETLQWDPAILSAMNVPAAILPEIRSSAEVYGTAVGQLAGVPVASALGDQQAAVFGQTCYGVGEAKNTYGTGCFLLLNTGNRPVPVQERAADDDGLPARRRGAGLLPGGVHRHHRRAGAVVPRPARHHRVGRRDRAAGGERRRTTAGRTSSRRSPVCSRPYWRSDARGVDHRPDPATSPRRIWRAPCWRRPAGRRVRSWTRCTRTRACGSPRSRSTAA